MRVIGITGGIGAGKSTVLRILQENWNAYVIEADKVGHRVMEPGGSCYDQVVSLFGDGVVKDDKTIDRKKVSDIVFAAPDKLQALNAVIHPAVKSEIRKKISEERMVGRNLFIVEAALLLEDHYEEICDEVWAVLTDREIRIQRLMRDRGYTLEKCESIIANQKDDAFYHDKADFVLYNNQEPETLKDMIRDRLSR